VILLNGSALSFAISAIAQAIAAEIPDDDQLALLSAVFTQLGDTLATLAAVRALQEGEPSTAGEA
jgi:hypothetical protein